MEPDMTLREDDPNTHVTLWNQAKSGNFRAVSRLISMAESNLTQTTELINQLGSSTGRTSVIGITGYPGAGKSTLINRLAAGYRAEGKKVGILTVDPSSPFSGGAILGDRIRMQDHSLDEHVYIRSMATRGHHGGLAKATGCALKVLEAAGFDVVLIETVGMGQEEGEIARFAQTRIWRWRIFWWRKRRRHRATLGAAAGGIFLWFWWKIIRINPGFPIFFLP